MFGVGFVRNLRLRTRERVGLLWYWPPGLSGDDWSKILVASRHFFASGQYSDHALRFERFDVIKEACAISYVAIFLLLIIHAAALGIATKCLCLPSTTSLLTFLLAFSILILLQQMHINNMWRQYLYARDLLVKDSVIGRKVEGLKTVFDKKIDKPPPSLCISVIATMLVLITLAYFIGAGASIMGVVAFDYPHP